MLVSSNTGDMHNRNLLLNSKKARNSWKIAQQSFAMTWFVCSLFSVEGLHVLSALTKPWISSTLIESVVTLFSFGRLVTNKGSYMAHITTYCSQLSWFSCLSVVRGSGRYLQDSFNKKNVSQNIAEQRIPKNKKIFYVLWLAKNQYMDKSV